MLSSRPDASRFTESRAARRPWAAPDALRIALVGVLSSAVLLGSAAPAAAVPPPPPNPSDTEIGAAQSAQDAAAAEVGRIAALVATAQAELERVTVQAESATAAYLAAEEALQQAQETAEQTAALLQEASDAIDAAVARLGTFARDSYMNGSTLTTTAALLDSAGPGELIQRAALLDYVGDTQVDALEQLEIARVQQANADSAARAARDAMADAEAEAEAAKAASDAQVAAQQAAYTQVTAQKAEYEQQLQAAQIRLLELQGARDAYQQWQQQKAAEEAAAAAAAARAAQEAAEAAAAARAAAAGNGSSDSVGSSRDGGVAPGSSNYVKPTSGRVSSCFGPRWGTMTYGLDIAAPIGTPIYAATSGVVKRAGTATGFGLAVYILGDDGAVTVYGHINRYFVNAGERVVAGQQIAEVGNRGQSTGPHLHFEVHPNGAMYSGAVDPVPWLRARGVSISGC